MNRVLVVSLTLCLASCSDDTWSTAPSSVRASVTSPTPNSPYRSKSVVGTFDFIFTVHPSCVQLPLDVRRRSYVMTLPHGAATATLSGGTFGGGDGRHAQWNVIYTRLSSATSELWFSDPPIRELLPGGRYLEIYGGGRGHLAEYGTSKMAFRARVAYCPAMSPHTRSSCALPLVTCESPDHELTLRRR